MDTKEHRAGLKACHCCGLVQTVPALAPRRVARCARCRAVVWDPARRRRHGLVAPLALAALALYPVAIALPVLRTERFGQVSEASIWSGTLSLLRHGELFVGAIVFLCSVVLPLAKLAALLAICTPRAGVGRRHRAVTYRLIEWTGRWGMLDVLAIAVVIAWVKLEGLFEVRPGPAALAFTLCVLLSLAAGALFDPHAVWEEEAPRPAAP